MIPLYWYLSDKKNIHERKKISGKLTQSRQNFLIRLNQTHGINKITIGHIQEFIFLGDHSLKIGG